MLAQRPPGAAPAVQAPGRGAAVRGRRVRRRAGRADDAPLVATGGRASPSCGASRARRIVMLTFDPALHLPLLARARLPAADRRRRTRRASRRSRPSPRRSAAPSIVPVPIAHDCSDGFLCAWWRRPLAYLEAERARQHLEPRGARSRRAAEAHGAARARRRRRHLGRAQRRSDRARRGRLRLPPARRADDDASRRRPRAPAAAARRARPAARAGCGASRPSGSRLVAVRSRKRRRIARERATRSAMPGRALDRGLGDPGQRGVAAERRVEARGIGREVGGAALEHVARAGRGDVRARERLVHAVARERIDEPGGVAHGERAPARDLGGRAAHGQAVPADLRQRRPRDVVALAHAAQVIAQVRALGIPAADARRWRGRPSGRASRSRRGRSPSRAAPRAARRPRRRRRRRRWPRAPERRCGPRRVAARGRRCRSRRRRRRAPRRRRASRRRTSRPAGRPPPARRCARARRRGSARLRARPARP